ncbi:MAG TPA: hypothetical protein VHD83_11840 [Puia sp.]|nr:hypothetical protein [Puia sp.]
MTMDSLEEKDLRASILLDSRNFLLALQSGASDEHLATSLSRIQEQERRLIRYQRTMLHPGMWNILRNRLLNRKNKEIIDTLSDLSAPSPK